MSTSTRITAVILALAALVGGNAATQDAKGQAEVKPPAPAESSVLVQELPAAAAVDLGPIRAELTSMAELLADQANEIESLRTQLAQFRSCECDTVKSATYTQPQETAKPAAKSAVAVPQVNRIYSSNCGPNGCSTTSYGRVGLFGRRR